MLIYFNKLTKDELKRFEEFILSPYCNKSKMNVRLFYYLKKLYPHISREDLAVKKISGSIYHEDPIDGAKVRKLISNFLTTFDNFLINECREKYVIEDGIRLLDKIVERHFKKRFLSLYKRYNALNEKQNIKNAEYYMNKAKLIDIMKWYQNEAITKYDTDLYQRQSDNLDYSYFISKLQLMSNMKGTENYYCEDLFHYSMKKEITNFIKENKAMISKEHHLVYLMYLASKLDDGFNQSAERNFIKYFKSLKFVLKAPDKYETYMQVFLKRLEYYYKLGIKNEIKGYDKKLSELYRWIFNNNYFQFFISAGILHFSVYLFIIRSAIFDKNFSWLEKFIEDTKVFLFPDESENEYNLAKALLYFGVKQFDKSFFYINKIKMTNSFYYKETKTLIAQIHFERKNFNNAEYIVKNMSKHFATNKKIFPIILREYLVTIKLFKQLLKIVNAAKSQREEAVFYLKKFEKELGLSKYNWFKEKALKIAGASPGGKKR